MSHGSPQRGMGSATLPSSVDGHLFAKAAHKPSEGREAAEHTSTERPSARSHLEGGADNAGLDLEQPQPSASSGRSESASPSPARYYDPHDLPTRAYNSWSKEESIKLASLVQHNGSNKKWSFIAKQLPGRTGKQCRDRWNNHLRPGLKQGAWSAEEDYVLACWHSKRGGSWAAIAFWLPGRTAVAIKNHWNAVNKLSEKVTKSTVLTVYAQLVRDGLDKEDAFTHAVAKVGMPQEWSPVLEQTMAACKVPPGSTIRPPKWEDILQEPVATPEDAYDDGDQGSPHGAPYVHGHIFAPPPDREPQYQSVIYRSLAPPGHEGVPLTLSSISNHYPTHRAALPLHSLSNLPLNPPSLVPPTYPIRRPSPPTSPTSDASEPPAPKPDAPHLQTPASSASPTSMCSNPSSTHIQQIEPHPPSASDYQPFAVASRLAAPNIDMRHLERFHPSLVEAYAPSYAPRGHPLEPYPSYVSLHDPRAPHPIQAYSYYTADLPHPQHPSYTHPYPDQVLASTDPTLPPLTHPFDDIRSARQQAALRIMQQRQRERALYVHSMGEGGPPPGMPAHLAGEVASAMAAAHWYPMAETDAQVDADGHAWASDAADSDAAAAAVHAVRRQAVLAMQQRAGGMAVPVGSPSQVDYAYLEPGYEYEQAVLYGQHVQGLEMVGGYPEDVAVLGDGMGGLYGRQYAEQYSPGLQGADGRGYGVGGKDGGAAPAGAGAAGTPGSRQSGEEGQQDSEEEGGSGMKRQYSEDVDIMETAPMEGEVQTRPAAWGDGAVGFRHKMMRCSPAP